MANETSVLFILFGATGDLASRKLYPSLFRLYQKGTLKDHFAVIGTARRPWTDDYFRQIIVASVQSLTEDPNEASAFASHFYYQSHDVSDVAHYAVLKDMAEKLDQQYQVGGNRLYYLAMAPQFFGPITGFLKSEGIVSETGFNRLVIEKPFGFSYDTAFALNEQIRRSFPEEDIFRIDHYLGKEMVQNISTVRFANPLFEKMWSRDYIDNVQITFAEELGVEDRGGYYENSGALKDMVQNHILQVLSLLAMEPPLNFSATHIREEKVKVLSAVRIYNDEEVAANFVRGQYDAGHLDQQDFIAYRAEDKVAPDSMTETFVAGKFMIDNMRWADVPFYVRTGKRLTEKGTRINITFKNLPIDVFKGIEASPAPIVLTIYIQPTEGFSLTMNAKAIGPNYQARPIKLDYRNSAELTTNSPEAYEKLLFDAFNGDSTNFTHWDEVANSWKIVDVIKAAWDKNLAPLTTYASRTMGPDESFALLQKEGRNWVWQPDTWYRERNLL